MKTILTVVGARPQFIKAGPVSKALSNLPNIKEIIVHTGQHFDANMSEIFFRQLNIPIPKINLKVNGGSHATQTAAMMTGLEAVMLEHTPDIALVYGDTNSTLAGALVAAKLDIPVAHIEAGLRSFNRKMPEEINRIMTDHASTLHFTPSSVATGHLRREGIDSNSIHQVGDVMYDAVLSNIERARKQSRALRTHSLEPAQFSMLTLHRAENTDDDYRLNTLLDEILQVAESEKILFPIHPRTQKALQRVGRLNQVAKKLFLIEPQSYLDTLHLVENSRVLLTDSGGMQKEAMFLRTPCVTLRNETEWVETVEVGANLLFQPGKDDLLAQVRHHLENSPSFQQQPYGNGNAASLIARTLDSVLNH